MPIVYSVEGSTFKVEPHAVLEDYSGWLFWGLALVAGLFLPGASNAGLLSPQRKVSPLGS